MSNTATRTYALTPVEAELIACFRLLTEPIQLTIITVIASQIAPERQELATPVKLSLVKTAALAE